MNVAVATTNKSDTRREAVISTRMPNHSNQQIQQQTGIARLQQTNLNR